MKWTKKFKGGKGKQRCGHALFGGGRVMLEGNRRLLNENAMKWKLWVRDSYVGGICKWLPLLCMVRAFEGQRICKFVEKKKKFVAWPCMFYAGYAPVLMTCECVYIYTCVMHGTRLCLCLCTYVYACACPYNCEFNKICERISTGGKKQENIVVLLCGTSDCGTSDCGTSVPSEFTSDFTLRYMQMKNESWNGLPPFWGHYVLIYSQSWLLDFFLESLVGDMDMIEPCEWVMSHM